jgi:hypothetical protein
MSNIFQDVITDSKGVEEKLLGPTYPYYNNIKTPAQIGMGDEGSLRQMGNDIDGLIEYVKLLVSGNSSASATGGPLGNKFFLQTGAKCLAKDSCTDANDSSTCKQVDRYIYVNNVPQGNIPFISSGMGVNFSEFKGLIPGTMSDLSTVNPFGIMRAFLSGSTPPCQEITLETINNDNIRSSESHYVTVGDISSMDPCVFPDKKNPITNVGCRETFQNNTYNSSVDKISSNINANSMSPDLPNDPIDQIYYASLACIGIYILYRIMEKSN